MSDNVKLTIRPLPHANFVREFPGIPPNSIGTRGPACVQGTVEVRTRQKGIKALSLHLEIRKLEIIPNGKATSRYREPLGDRPIALWQAGGKRFSGSGESSYDTLTTSDYSFNIPLLETLPPSVLIDRKSGTGITFELIVTLLAKPKTGFFGGSNKGPERIVETVIVVIEKHDMHPGWPIYHYRAQVEDRRESLNKLYMTVKRDTVAYGPGDHVVINVKLRSQRLDPVKLSRIELVLKEVITFKADIKDPNSAGHQQTIIVIEAKQWFNKTIYPQDEGTFTVQGLIPLEHSRVSVTSGRHIAIVYHAGVRAVIEKERGTAGPIADLLIDFLPTTIAGMSKERGNVEIAKILKTGGGMPENVASPGPLPLRASTLGDGDSSSGAPSQHGPETIIRAPLDRVAGFRLVNGSPSPPVSTSNFDTTGQMRQQTSFGHQTTRSMSNPRSALSEEGSPTSLRRSSQLIDGAKQRLAAARMQQETALDPLPDFDEQPPPAPTQAYPSAEEEKAALRRKEYEQISPSVARPPMSLPEPMQSVVEPRQQPASQWPSAAEEKQKLYEAAVRERESPVVAQEADVFVEPRPVASQLASLNFDSAEREKERLYREAIDQRPSLRAGPNGTTSPSGPRPLALSDFESAEREKERLYQEAIGQRPLTRAPSEEVQGSPEPMSTTPQSPWSRFGKSETEKTTLYENAIKEREEYDGPYAQAIDVQYADAQQMIARATSAAHRYAQAIEEQNRYAKNSGSMLLPLAPSEPAPSPPTASSSKTPLTAEDEKSLLSAHYANEAAQRPPSTASGERRLYEEAVAMREKAVDDLRSSTGSIRSGLPLPPPSRQQQAQPLMMSAPADRPPVIPQASRPTYANTEDEKAQLARYQAAVDARERQFSEESYIPGLLGSQLQRRPSEAESTSSSIPDEPRDPSIALGKRRADPPAAQFPPQAESVYARRATYDVAYMSALHDPRWHEVQRPREPPGRPDPPGRPPKTPLLQ